MIVMIRRPNAILPTLAAPVAALRLAARSDMPRGMGNSPAVRSLLHDREKLQISDKIMHPNKN
jgi:hypothetical protein